MKNWLLILASVSTLFFLVSCNSGKADKSSEVFTSPTVGTKQRPPDIMAGKHGPPTATPVRSVPTPNNASKSFGDCPAEITRVTDPDLLTAAFKSACFNRLGEQLKITSVEMLGGDDQSATVKVQGEFFNELGCKVKQEGTVSLSRNINKEWEGNIWLREVDESQRYNCESEARARDQMERASAVGVVLDPTAVLIKELDGNVIGIKMQLINLSDDLSFFLLLEVPDGRTVTITHFRIYEIRDNFPVREGYEYFNTNGTFSVDSTLRDLRIEDVKVVAYSFDLENWIKITK